MIIQWQNSFGCTGTTLYKYFGGKDVIGIGAGFLE